MMIGANFVERFNLRFGGCGLNIRLVDYYEDIMSSLSFGAQFFHL